MKPAFSRCFVRLAVLAAGALAVLGGVGIAANADGMPWLGVAVAFGSTRAVDAAMGTVQQRVAAAVTLSGEAVEALRAIATAAGLEVQVDTHGAARFRDCLGAYRRARDAALARACAGDLEAARREIPGPLRAAYLALKQAIGDLAPG